MDSLPTSFWGIRPHFACRVAERLDNCNRGNGIVRGNVGARRMQLLGTFYLFTTCLLRQECRAKASVRVGFS